MSISTSLKGYVRFLRDNILIVFVRELKVFCARIVKVLCDRV